MPELTGPQVLLSLFGPSGVMLPNWADELPPSYDQIWGGYANGAIEPLFGEEGPGEWTYFWARRMMWYRLIRAMRRHPTIALARTLSVAPALASTWSYEANADAPEGAKEFIQKLLEPYRMHILYHAFSGCLDFGWQPFEIVWEVDEEGQTVWTKLKPLLQDITYITIDPRTGAFTGFKQAPYSSYFLGDGDVDGGIKIDGSKALLFNFDVEGTNWYGQSTMRIAEHSFRSWLMCDRAFDKYDHKIAGSHWVIHYPNGTSLVNGTNVDNFEVATRIISQLEASGAVAVPSSISAFIDDLNKDSEMAWKIELLSDEGKGAVSFLDRQKYLDALLARSFSLPERSVIEGQFGTKAEAGEHGDFALTHIETRHKGITQQVNWHLVDRAMSYNYGPKTAGSVWCEPTPLSDESIGFFRDLFKTLVMNPNLGPMEMNDVDMDAVKDKLGIPRRETAVNDDVKAPDDVMKALQYLDNLGS